MRKLLIVLLLLGMSTSVLADTILEEDFEAAVPPTGWSVDGTETAPYTWHQLYAYYRVYSAGIYGSAAASDEMLYTTQIDLTGYDSAEVTFYNMGYTAGYAYGTNVTLEVSTDVAKATWTPVWTFPGEAGWGVFFEGANVDLSDYTGQSIWLGWRHTYDGTSGPSGHYHLVDDVKVQAFDEFCNIRWLGGYADIPHKHHRAGGGAYNGKLYVWGGWDIDANDVRTDTVVYDPAADSWTATAALPVKKANFGTGFIGDYGYAIAGYDGSTGVGSAHKYDIAGDSWTAITDYPLAESGIACAAGDDGMLYCFGGSSDTLSGYKYDPTGDAWTAIADMPSPKAFPTAAYMDGVVYAGSAWGTTSMLAYDIAGDNRVFGIFQHTLERTFGSLLESGIHRFNSHRFLAVGNKIGNRAVSGRNTKCHTIQFALQVRENLADSTSSTGRGRNNTAGSIACTAQV